MAEFTPAYNLTKGHEGIYSVDPNDRGGETVFGIARKMHPNWRGWIDIDNLKILHPNLPSLTIAISNSTVLKLYAKAFYEEEFWQFLKLNQFNSQVIANELFDTAVNQGKQTAAKYLQQALNLLNDNQKLFLDLKVDGDIGNITLSALKKYLNTGNWRSRNPSQVERTLLKVLNGLQFNRYKSIVESNPNQEMYFYGWINTRIN